MKSQVGNEHHDVDVELDASDLLALAPAPAAPPPTVTPVEVPAALTPSTPTSTSTPSSPVARPTSSSPSTARRWGLWVGIALLAAAMAAGAYLLDATQPTATPPEPQPAADARWVPVPEVEAVEVPPEPQSKPVKFANPFDATEVFEFPPGTTREEARAQVAEFLLQRAREREQAGALRRKH